MAVTFTTRLGLPRWSAGTDPITRAQVDAGNASLEGKAVIFAEGTLAARPAPALVGRLYRVTNPATRATTVFYDTGTAWTEFSPDLTAYALSSDVNGALAGKANTGHTHTASDTTSGVFSASRLGSGAPSAATWLRGDGTWQVLPTTTFAGLSDVTFTSLAAGHVPVYNPGTGRWNNRFLNTSEVTGLDTALASKAAAVHTHTKSQITDFAHVHPTSEVTGLDGALAGKSNTGHTHSTGDVSGLDGALAGKSNTGHLHNTADVNGLDGALAGKAAAVHGHQTADVAGLDTALAGKAAVSHSHGIGDLPVAASGESSATKLTRSDDNRLSNPRTPTAHTHPSTDVTGLGNAATRNVGTTGGTVAAGDDARLSDPRTPVAHTHDDRYFTEGESDGRFTRYGAQASFRRDGAGNQSYANAALIVENDTGAPAISFHNPNEFAPQLRAVSGSQFEFVNIDGNAYVNTTAARVDGWSGVFDAGTRVSTQGHVHDDRYFTEGEADGRFAGKAANNVLTGTNQFTGRVEVGDTNADVQLVRSLTVEADTRNLVLSYNGDGTLSSVAERDGGTTLSTSTLGYTGGRVTSVTETVDGKNITTTLAYTGDNVTSVTRSVA